MSVGIKIDDRVFAKNFNRYGLVVGKTNEQFIVRLAEEENVHFFFQSEIELADNSITKLDTQQVWNALHGTDGWKRIIHDFKCTKKHCNLSGMWFTKMDGAPNGEEHYRCNNCGQVHIFRVPLSYECG